MPASGSPAASWPTATRRSTAVTGVGGPGPEEGRDAGTVFICAASRTGIRDAAHAFAGGPDEVVARSIEHALRLLLEFDAP